MKFQRLFQIVKCFFFRGPLTGDINFQALRYKPVPFAPDSSSKWPLHKTIVSYLGVLPYLALCFAPHAAINPRSGFSVSPCSVSEYSTLGGISP